LKSKVLLSEFEQKADEMASKGYRVLGYAIKIDALRTFRYRDARIILVVYRLRRNDRSTSGRSETGTHVKKRV
jgi:magnesium-transporting ATPase (P-type)